MLKKSDFMEAQISLTVDDKILREAEAFAKAHNQSLGEILTQYLKDLAQIQQAGGFMPVVDQMIGVVSNDNSFLAEEAKWSYLREKYLEK